MTPKQAYNICRNNRQRYKDLELIIIKDSYYSYFYARDVIQGRWTEAEDIISTNSCYIYYYALDVIKGKLPENMHNAMILHADDYAKEYFKLIK
jgi:hypothetical protein